MLNFFLLFKILKNLEIIWKTINLYFLYKKNKNSENISVNDEHGPCRNVRHGAQEKKKFQVCKILFLNALMTNAMLVFSAFQK